MARKKQDQIAGFEKLPDLLTKKQVAGYFSCSVRTVDRMIVDGLCSIRVRGKRYFTESQLRDYILRRKTA